MPRQGLTFTLVNSPPGASINPTNGQFAWTTSLAPVTTTNQMTVRVTDDGLPPLSDAKTVQIVVVAAPRFTAITNDGSDSVILTWQSQPGKTYRVNYTLDLSIPWVQLGDDVIATDVTTTKTDPTTTGQQRFYRIVQVD